MKSKYTHSPKCRRVESSLNNAAETMDVSFLELAQAASSAVVRVLHNMRGWRGTGFMISDRLFMTNNHVIPDSTKAKEFFVEFNYELDPMNVPKAVTSFALSPNDFFISSPEDDLDFTILALGNRLVGKGKLSDFGFCPIFEDDSSAGCRWANIIHHPQGRFKHIIIRQNQIVATNRDVLQYYAETEVGSSGAPVFNDDWETIALHHWRAPTKKAFTPEGKPGPKDTREGICISAIVERINSEKEKLSQKQRALIDTALSCRFRHPSVLKRV